MCGNSEWDSLTARQKLRFLKLSGRNYPQRLARIVVNGVRDNDLAEESLNDLLRAATDLTEQDVHVLKTVAAEQREYSAQQIYLLSTSDGTINLPRELWQILIKKFISPENQLIIRSSLVRLQALGFGTEIQTMESVWYPRFVVSPDGEKFLTRLRDLV